jgi:hypothetical protein
MDHVVQQNSDSAQTRMHTTLMRPKSSKTSPKHMKSFPIPRNDPSTTNMVRKD